MPKITIWTLMGIATFLLVIGSILPSLFLIFGIFFIAFGLYIGSKPSGVLKKEQILNNQEVLAVDNQNKSGEVSESPDNPIRQSKALAIKMKIKEKEDNKEEIEERTESYGGKINQMQGWENRVPRKGLALIVLGILFLVISYLLSGVSSVFTIFSYLGFLLIGIGFYLALKNMLRKEQVMDSWSMLIENGQGRFNEVFQDTESFIKESKAPSLETRRSKMAPGIIGSFFGARRDFLVVKDQQSSMLSPYQIFINARDYGNNLDISWYLTYRPSMWEALVGAFRSKSPMALEELDLFELQDLTAYTTVCHHSTLKAVRNLMLGLDQDPSKIERKSKGFLGIS